MTLNKLALALSSALALNTVALGAHASAPTSSIEFQESSIERITVHGTTHSSISETGLKTPTRLLDVPNSISVVYAEQISEQAFNNIGDILRFTPGASVGQGEGHRDQITLRGQNTTADFFIDGLRDDVQYYRPLYNLASVEILRGSNALLYGRGGGGGIVNRVTKTAQLDEDFHSISAGIDTFGAASISTDNNFVIDTKQAFRINAFYESMDNHRDFNDGKRYAINPTYTNQLNDKTTLVLSYELVDDDRLIDRGIPSLDNQPLDGQRDTYFGAKDFNRTTLEAHIMKARVDHKLNADWTVNGTLQYADFDKLYQNLYPAGYDASTNLVTLDGYIDATERENLILQVNAVGTVSTGNVEHTILVGAEYGQQDSANNRRDTLFPSTNDDQATTLLTDVIVVPDFGFTDPVRDRESDVTFASVFIQDEVQVTDNLILVAGLRLDQFDIDVVDLYEISVDASAENTGFLSSDDSEVSPRVGVIYKPHNDVSIYASYSQSFLPRSGDQFLSLSLSSAALEAESFENKEIGIKYDFESSVSLSAAVFEIERENGIATDPNNPERSIITGTTTKGLELQLVGNVSDNLSINAGYSYLDGDSVTASGTAVLSQVPEHMFSLWSRYNLNEKVDLALGVTHQSEQFASLNNTVELPSYTRVDAAIYYEVNDDIRVQLNIENLFDEEYFPDAHNDNNISTGEPLNARLGVTYKF